jgi:hypothetical protein
MLNPFFTKEIIQGVVLELGSVVTSYSQYILPKLTFNFFGKVNDGVGSHSCIQRNEPMYILNSHQQSPSNISSHQGLHEREDQRDPHEGAPKSSWKK